MHYANDLDIILENGLVHGSICQTLALWGSLGFTVLIMSSFNAGFIALINAAR